MDPHLEHGSGKAAHRAISDLHIGAPGKIDTIITDATSVTDQAKAHEVEGDVIGSDVNGVAAGSTEGQVAAQKIETWSADGKTSCGQTGDFGAHSAAPATT